MIIYGYHVNNVLINSVEFSHCLDFRTSILRSLQDQGLPRRPVLPEGRDHLLPVSQFNIITGSYMALF